MIQNPCGVNLEKLVTEHLVGRASAAECMLLNDSKSTKFHVIPRKETGGTWGVAGFFSNASLSWVVSCQGSIYEGSLPRGILSWRKLIFRCISGGVSSSFQTLRTSAVMSLQHINAFELEGRTLDCLALHAIPAINGC